jgi:ABC-type phosphate transport system substrate-binding protein
LTICFTANPVWAGKIVIKGSTTVLPIAQKVAEIYMKDNPDVKISKDIRFLLQWLTTVSCLWCIQAIT